MCNIIMCGHTATTDTRRHIKQGLPVKNGGSMLVDWIAWLPQIGDGGWGQGHSREAMQRTLDAI